MNGVGHRVHGDQTPQPAELSGVREDLGRIEVRRSGKGSAFRDDRRPSVRAIPHLHERLAVQ